MVSVVTSGVPDGMEGRLIYVEVDVGNGLPSFSVVGLPNTAVQEAKARVRSALINSGFSFPAKKITVNLSPADCRKRGTHLDLPIAVGIVAASEPAVKMDLNHIALAGELSLDGNLKPVTGAISLAAGISAGGIRKILLPAENAGEAAFVDGIQSYPVSTLLQAVHFLMGRYTAQPARKMWRKQGTEDVQEDFSDVAGQTEAIRMIAVAAGGFHSLLLTGPAGSGKSMLIKRMPTIMADLSEREQTELMNIYGGITEKEKEKRDPCRPPFRMPHHTCSVSAMTGGGRIPQPGEITLAHRGILFLDEIVEFDKRVLEALRQPLEDGIITVAREMAVVTYPTRFLLAAARNPCPCGFFGDGRRVCRCSENQIRRYREKVSEALLDRFDLFLDVEPEREALFEMCREKNKEKGISSREIRKQVELARAVQKKRYGEDRTLYNGQLSPEEIKRYCPLHRQVSDFLEEAARTLGMSTRAIHKTVKVARTIADMQESREIQVSHAAEALQYRRRQNDIF